MKDSASEPVIRETVPQEKVQRAVADLSSYIAREFNFSTEDVAIIGIQARGALLAHRVAEWLQKEKNIHVPVGELDITLYRDDFGTQGVKPLARETRMNFDIDGKQIILIDDVLFTGRTIRAALDEIMDFGRPKRIALAVLVDRGHRELPIAPDFAAIKISTQRNESVNLHLTELDKKEEIVVYASNAL